MTNLLDNTLGESASGVPCARSRTAVRSLMAMFRAVFANELHDLLDVLDRRIRDDAVAEIENMTGPAPCQVEDLTHPLAYQLRLGEESDGVEVALDSTGMVERMPRPVERRPPVEAEDVGSGLLHRWEQTGGVHTEVDRWDSHLLQLADEGLRCRQDVVAVVLYAQRSGPAVEDLDHVGSGLDLLAGKVAEDGDKLVEEPAPHIRL